MDCLLGIDLGTSSVRAMLMGYDGSILSLAQEGYNFEVPREGWVEQDPESWWQAATRTITKTITLAETPVSIRGIGLSGQMHGLVALDKTGRCVRKAILWCDQRTAPQVDTINKKFSTEKVGSLIHGPMAVGFQAASVLWLIENEPGNYERIAHIILPKDYIRYRLTGEIACDITDAAGSGFLDCNTGKWSAEMLDGLSVSRSLFPRLGYPHEIAGVVTSSAADVTGIAIGTPVVYGGADQVMQAIGNGVIEPGIASVTIGTGGQVLMPLAASIYDKKLRAHSFCFFAPSSWYYMGAALSSGLALKWARSLFDDSESFKSIDERCAGIPAGSEGLLFLPYLAGERTPYMNPYARSVFFGLTLNHSKYHLYHSIMEGVCFSIKDCFEILTKDLGQECLRLITSGGGAKSRLWTQMLADILGIELYQSCMKEQSSYGAAIAAGVGCGVYADYYEACSQLIKRKTEPVVPNVRTHKTYCAYFDLYKQLYTNTYKLMLSCGKLSQVKT